MCRVQNMNKEFLAKEYKAMHDKKNFSGSSLEPYLPEIKQLIKEYGCQSLLDYGCGKARYHKQPLVTNTTLYDPYFEPYSKLPTGTFDMVICTDVLEHVPEKEVPNIVADLINYTDKVLFLAISTKPAKKKFSNGENVHLTVWPPKKWDRLIDAFISDGIKIVRHYS